MVALPGWSTGPLAENTTCMLRIENGRMPFTVMLQLEGLAFPHHVGLLCELVFFSVSLPPNTVNMQQQHFSPHQNDEAHGATS